MSDSETKKYVFSLGGRKRFFSRYTVTSNKNEIIVTFDPDSSERKKFEITTYGEYGQWIPYYSLYHKRFFLGDVEKDKKDRDELKQIAGCYTLKLIGKTMSVIQTKDSLQDPNKMKIVLKDLRPPDSIMEYLKQIGYGERNGWAFGTRDYVSELTVRKQMPAEKLDEYNNKMERFKQLMGEVEKLGTFNRFYIPSIVENFQPIIEYPQEIGFPVGIDLEEAGFVVYGFINDALYQHVMSDENYDFTTRVSIRECSCADTLTNVMVMQPYENATVYHRYGNETYYHDLYGGMARSISDTQCYKFYLCELDFDLELEKVRSAAKDVDIPDLHPLARLFDPDNNRYSGKKFSNYILGRKGDKIYKYALDHYPVMFFS